MIFTISFLERTRSCDELPCMVSSRYHPPLLVFLFFLFFLRFGKCLLREGTQDVWGESHNRWAAPNSLVLFFVFVFLLRLVVWTLEDCFAQDRQKEKKEKRKKKLVWSLGLIELV